MSEKRRDNRNRILQIGEYQRADGRYRYHYIDENGQERYAYGGASLGKVHGACGCQVQQDLSCAAAEDHTPCMSAHFLFQQGKVRDESQDTAVYHGSQ